MNNELPRRTFGKRIFGGLAALVVVLFAKPEKKSLTADELKKIAEQNPPPAEWYEGEEQFVTLRPFVWNHTIKYENGRTEFYEDGKLVGVIELRDRSVGTF